jgi:glutathione synthase/RimK-type ligase-like ATP-grasp enzyme
MILVAGSLSENMVTRVYEELKRRERPVRLVETQHLPDRVRVSLGLPARDFHLRLENDEILELSSIQSIYQRVGFLDSLPRDDWSEEESRYALNQTVAAMNALFNHAPCLVVNRPLYSGSNASKPYQISLIAQHGFDVPRTVVTNHADVAADFYQRMNGEVIYKSVSYVRSIVQSMTPEDLERLNTLRNCPVQLQEKVIGTDYRVHVVGDRAAFATRISTEQSDYRYDKSSEIEAAELPSDLEQRCFEVTRALGFHMSGIDLRITADGRCYCFEVNPSPAFTWYEDRTGQPITAALCDLLSEPPAT